MHLLLRLSLVASLLLVACRPDGADSDGGTGTGGGTATGGGSATGGGTSTRVPVTVTLSGDGVGVITSTPAGLSCPGTCTLDVEPGTTVTLSQAAASGSTFTGWSGACSGAGPCSLTPTSAVTVIAGFAKNNTLLVTRAGTGTGTVTSTPAGIDCGADCSESYAPDAVVTLTAAPASGSTFTGWSGACSGTGTCSVTMAAAQSVTATFTLAQFALTVVRAGTGDGQVSSAPAGISCGTDCIESYDSGTLVTLTASAASASTFGGWSGACTGTGACTVTVAAATTVTATFVKDRFDLSVMKLGTGSGTVTSTPAGLSCGPSCASRYDSGTVVTLTATPDTGSSFTGWSGSGCSGTGACTVTVLAAQLVTATFTLNDYALTVTRSGAGSGVVTSSPVGISCGADCSEPYPFGTMVTLTASPAMGSSFTGWSGACTGTATTCTVLVDAAQGVDAQFSPIVYPLTVTKAGTGAGVVTSSPGGLSCGATCSADFNVGTVVALTAAASTGSTFAGWSGGGCSGTGACVVSVSAATAVTATFTLNQYLLSVVVQGGGTVTSSPVGITCGTDCSEPYDYGTSVTLTASAAGATFAGWSGGGCTGTGTCSVTMAAATTVTARFVRPTLTVELLGTGAANLSVASSPGGISCGATCSAPFNTGTTVTLTATRQGAVFTGWSGGGCTGTGTCTLTLTADTLVRANFRPLRVALETSANSCLRGPTEVFPRARAVLEARGHTVSIVTGGEIATPALLAAFDVVVLPGPGAACVQPDWAAFDAALSTWVNAGGGVVGSGWQVYASFSPTVVALLPVSATPSYLTGTQTVVPLGVHPVSTGLASFTTLEWLPWGAQRSGAITLAQVGTTNVASVWDVGTGRGAFLGPMYLESYAAYQNEGLLDGTAPSAVELFGRTVEWAGKAR